MSVEVEIKHTRNGKSLKSEELIVMTEEIKKLKSERAIDKNKVVRISE